MGCQCCFRLKAQVNFAFMISLKEKVTLLVCRKWIEQMLIRWFFFPFGEIKKMCNYMMRTIHRDWKNWTPFLLEQLTLLQAINKKTKPQNSGVYSLQLSKIASNNCLWLTLEKRWDEGTSVLQNNAGALQFNYTMMTCKESHIIPSAVLGFPTLNNTRKWTVFFKTH